MSKEVSTESTLSPKKKKNIKKTVLIAVIVAFGLFLICLAVGYAVFQHYYSKMNYEALSDDYVIVSAIDADDDLTDEEDSSAEEISELEAYLAGNLTWDDFDASILDDENVRHILLIGIDSRSNTTSGSRSDSMIIISINSKTEQIVMTSVMRDTYVYIPNVGYNRINAAYAYGGVNLLLATIEANFKISIDEYMTVNFYSFMDVVDTVGGVTLNVTAAEIKVMQSYIRELNNLEGVSSDTDMLYESDAGTITLNGKQALAYCRVRYVGNADFGRTERQRKVLTQVFNKAKSMSLSELNSLANALLPNVTTNLTQADVLGLVLNSGSYLNYELVSCRMPIDGSYKYLTIRGMSVLGVDFESNFKYWYNAVYKGEVTG